MGSDPPDLGKGLFGYRKSAVNQIIADRDMMLRQAEGRVRAAEAKVAELEVELSSFRERNARIDEQLDRLRSQLDVVLQRAEAGTLVEAPPAGSNQADYEEGFGPGDRSPAEERFSPQNFGSEPAEQEASPPEEREPEPPTYGWSSETETAAVIQEAATLPPSTDEGPPAWARSDPVESDEAPELPADAASDGYPAGPEPPAPTAWGPPVAAGQQQYEYPPPVPPDPPAQQAPARYSSPPPPATGPPPAPPRTDDPNSRFLTEELAGILAAAEESAARILERARSSTQRQITESNRLWREVQAEVARFASWRDQVEPVIRQVQSKVDSVRETVEDVPERIRNALAPMADAISSIDADMSELASALTPPLLLTPSGLEGEVESWLSRAGQPNPDFGVPSEEADEAPRSYEGGESPGPFGAEAG